MYFSKRCSKCENGNEHPDDLCANLAKYDKSLRAIESIGAVEMVLSIGMIVLTVTVLLPL
jgi:hypothetical protein